MLQHKSMVLIVFVLHFSAIIIHVLLRGSSLFSVLKLWRQESMANQVFHAESSCISSLEVPTSYLGSFLKSTWKFTKNGPLDLQMQIDWPRSTKWNCPFHPSLYFWQATRIRSGLIPTTDVSILWQFFTQSSAYKITSVRNWKLKRLGKGIL